MNIADYPDFEKFGTPLCRNVPDPDIFFPEAGDPLYTDKVQEAVKVCEKCPYMKACFDWAYENEDTGVWGGKSALQRQVMRRREAQGIYRRIEPQASPEPAGRIGLD